MDILGIYPEGTNRALKMESNKASEVSVSVTTTAHVVCPKCGELIKVKIVALSGQEERDERTDKSTDKK